MKIHLIRPQEAHNTLLLSYNKMPREDGTSAPEELLEKIAISDDQAVGFVRMGRYDDKWFVSLFVKPEHRKQGIGKTILQLSIHLLQKYAKEPVKIYGDVSKQQIGAIKLFESVNFNCTLVNNGLGFFHRFWYTLDAHKPQNVQTNRKNKLYIPY